ncbi:thermonuclease family protein [Devosia ginsengisoli]|uniref:thermonuclease family protein n=1 Tax=Devosia ginsengisoli TaxID=400770 RepID=UPI0026EC87F5|nr:thermonuclease family protein [Devosia ginsengisoli]MCR6673848.1 thermonuclease family protein [Devosia ginsengisoli]
MASRTSLRLVTKAGGRRALSNWILVPAFLVVGGLGGALLGALPEQDLARLLNPPASSNVVAVPQTFAVCAGSVRIDCVVDGDTFWLAGVKIRIADINTPEVSSPACAAEAALGRRATTRLRELLSAGSFELQLADRDEDVYGRKLRVVVRGGQSIGDTMVAEGLAHHWRGYKEGWC